MPNSAEPVGHLNLLSKTAREIKTYENFLFFIGFVFLFIFLLSSCSGLHPAKDTSFRQKGMASWYGEKFHGRKTANGETYNMHGLTAAHRSLPFGTYLRVTHRISGKSVEVKINDRGPFVRGRFLDLSYGAAKALGMVEAGVAPVMAESFHPKRKKGPSHLSGQKFTVQVASFRSFRSATHLKKRLLKWYNPVVVKSFEGHEGKFFRVRVGQFKTSQEAQRVAKRLKQQQGLVSFVTLTQN